MKHLKKTFSLLTVYRDTVYHGEQGKAVDTGGIYQIVCTVTKHKKINLGALLMSSFLIQSRTAAHGTVLLTFRLSQ